MLKITSLVKLQGAISLSRANAKTAITRGIVGGNDGQLLSDGEQLEREDGLIVGELLDIKDGDKDGKLLDIAVGLELIDGTFEIEGMYDGFIEGTKEGFVEDVG